MRNWPLQFEMRIGFIYRDEFHHVNSLRLDKPMQWAVSPTFARVAFHRAPAPILPAWRPPPDVGPRSPSLPATAAWRFGPAQRPHRQFGPRMRELGPNPLAL